MMIPTKPRLSHLFLYLGLLLPLLGTSTPSYAAKAERPLPSTIYDIAFAYGQLTATPPDFKSLLQADRSWTSLDDLTKKRTLDKRIEALTQAYASYSPASTPLVVRAPVRVHLSPRPPGLVLGYLSNNLPYFPFWDGRRVLTLYTEDMPMLSILPVDDDLALKRAGYLTDDENNLFLDLILTRKPAQEPTLIDGEPQILIPARVARVRLLNQGDQSIWEWVNPAFDYIYRRTIPRM